LTILAFVIGISTIVALVSVGQGLKTSVEVEFEKLGTDKIFIDVASGFLPPGTDISTAKLTEDDLDEIRGVLGVDEAAGYLFRSAKIEFKDEVRFFGLIGVPTDQESKLVQDVLFTGGVEEGRNIDKNDFKKVAVGSRLKHGDLFPDEVRVRDSILINDVKFSVVGVYEPIGSSEDDSLLVVSERAFRSLYNVSNEWTSLMASTTQDPALVASRIERQLRKSRDVEEGKEDFTVRTATEFLGAFGNVLDILNVFLVGIGFISLLVGGIGIMNTMYTSVLERTKEIGIMKSIGATNNDIFVIFLIESGLIGLFGGVIGVVIGSIMAKLVEIAIASTGNTFLKVIFPWWLIVGALAFAMIVGTVSGVLPAIQASRQKPTEALRYE